VNSVFWTKQKRVACKQYEASLEEHLQGQLPQPRARDLEAHLASCTGCRRALDAARASLRLLGAVREPAGEPGPGFSQRVMAAIQSEEARRRTAGEFWRPLESWAWRLTWSASLTLALLAAYLFGFGAARRQSILPAQQTEVRELFPESAAPPADREEALLALVELNHHGR
jgi:anti-sigma factor RsiW